MGKSISYTSIIYFILRASFIGISFSLLLEISKQDSWIVILLSYLIGIIPLLLIEYIAKYKSDKTFLEKTKLLFPKTNKLIILFMLITFFFITIINFCNLANLITSQFLSKTPNLVILISFIIPIGLLVSKDRKIIARVSLILFYIGIILFISCVLGLITKFKLSNFEPVMINPISKSIYSYMGFHIMPLFLILFFPNNEIILSLKKGYLISSITLFLTFITIIGILGVELCLIYQYPEFHILKQSYEGILTVRLENIFAVQCIFDIFIFCVVCLKNCNSLLNINNGLKQIILPIILVIISFILMKTNSITNNNHTLIISNLFSISFTFLIVIYSFKIYIMKRKKRT